MNLRTYHPRPNGRLRLFAAAEFGAGDYFWHAAEAYPADTCLLIPGQDFATPWGEAMVRPTLRDWVRIASRLARCYGGMGIRPRDAVGVYGRFGAGYFLHFLALTRLGAIPVLVNEGMPPDVAVAYLERAGVRAVIHDAITDGTWNNAPYRAVPEAMLAEADEQDFVPYLYKFDDPVLVTHSSGTTGVPKAVTLKHGPYFYAMSKSLEAPRDPAVRLAVSALPPSHNSAIGAAAIAVINGETLVMMPNQDGAAAIRAIARHGASCLVAFPRTFVDILIAEPDPSDLQTMELWVNLGDAAHEAHIRQLTRFGQRVARGQRLPGSRFVDGLGSSEMGSMLFSKVHEPNERGSARCVGKPARWVEAAILGEDGTLLPDGVSGRLCVRSPGTFSGYWNNATLAEASVSNGYFLTGDIAMRDASGRYFHLDRVTDQVGSGGRPIYTLQVEEAIMLGCEQVLDCCVVAGEISPGRALVKCLAVLRPGAIQKPDTLLPAINKTLRAAQLPSVDVLEIVERASVPVGVTGKTLKAQIRQEMIAQHRSRTSARAEWKGGFRGGGIMHLGENPLPMSLVPRTGTGNASFSPMSLVVGATSACYAATLSSLVEAAGIDAHSIDIHSSASFAKSSLPRLEAILHRVEVVLPPGAHSHADEVTRLFEVARSRCPTGALFRDVDVSVEGVVKFRNISE